MRYSVIVLFLVLAVSLATPPLAAADPSCIDKTQEPNYGPYYDPDGLAVADCFGPYGDPEGSAVADPSCIDKTQELNHGPYYDPEG